MTGIPLHISKYHGTGNDFIMIDNRDLSFDVKSGRIASLCNRHFGVGADGLILIERDQHASFAMRYFNADGKESTMCGNGGRCAVAFARSLELFTGDKVAFVAADGLHHARLNKDTITLKMKDAAPPEVGKDYFLVDTGSPHYVTFHDEVKKMNVLVEGLKIRYSSSFQPEGINVNFTEIIAEGVIFNRTYERGVENETLSCGTGSVAAAISTVLKRQYDITKVTVQTLGGELTVRFQRQPDDRFTEIWLEGPATRVFSGVAYVPPA